MNPTANIRNLPSAFHGRLLAAALGILACFSAHAQTTPESKKDVVDNVLEKIEHIVLPEDFSRLNGKKKRLEGEIADWSKERDQQNARLEEARAKLRFLEDRVERDKSQARAMDSELKKPPSSKAQNRSSMFSMEASVDELENIKSRITRTEADASQTKATITSSEVLLKRAVEKLTTARSDLSLVEQTIDQALNIEASRLKWRTVIALMFCVVLVVLIWWFFKIAQADEVVRRAVFSAQAGIQFLTLFCLVISIVLFGVAGILEGKELSALLGGLSGYILGRVTTAPTKG